MGKSSHSTLTSAMGLINAAVDHRLAVAYRRGRSTVSGASTRRERTAAIAPGNPSIARAGQTTHQPPDLQFVMHEWIVRRAEDDARTQLFENAADE